MEWCERHNVEWEGPEGPRHESERNSDRLHRDDERYPRLHTESVPTRPPAEEQHHVEHDAYKGNDPAQPNAEPQKI